MRIVLLDPPEGRKKGRWHPLLEWRIRREIRSQGLLEQEEIYHRLRLDRIYERLHQEALKDAYRRLEERGCITREAARSLKKREREERREKPRPRHFGFFECFGSEKPLSEEDIMELRKYLDRKKEEQGFTED